MECKVCGRSKSRSGKQFTKVSLNQHMKDMHGSWEDGDPTFELTDMIADDDMPDGAYFALAWELGELP